MSERPQSGRTGGLVRTAAPIACVTLGAAAAALLLAGPLAGAAVMAAGAVATIVAAARALAQVATLRAARAELAAEFAVLQALLDVGGPALVVSAAGALRSSNASARALLAAFPELLRDLAAPTAPAALRFGERTFAVRRARLDGPRQAAWLVTLEDQTAWHELSARLHAAGAPPAPQCGDAYAGLVGQIAALDARKAIGSEHLRAGCDEIDRVQSLIADAIETLIVSFGGLQHNVARQHELASALATAEHNGPSDVVAQTRQTLLALRVNADEVKRDIGAAVISLQFHDLTSQLLAHTRERLGVLCQVLDGVVELEPVAAVSAVTQSDMTSGPVDLF